MSQLCLQHCYKNHPQQTQLSKVLISPKSAHRSSWEAWEKCTTVLLFSEWFLKLFGYNPCTQPGRRWIFHSCMRITLLCSHIWRAVNVPACHWVWHFGFQHCTELLLFLPNFRNPCYLQILNKYNPSFSCPSEALTKEYIIFYEQIAF